MIPVRNSDPPQIETENVRRRRHAKSISGCSVRRICSTASHPASKLYASSAPTVAQCADGCPISSRPYIKAMQAEPASAKPSQSKVRFVFSRSLSVHHSASTVRDHAQRHVQVEDPAP